MPDTIDDDAAAFHLKQNPVITGTHPKPWDEVPQPLDVAVQIMAEFVDPRADPLPLI